MSVEKLDPKLDPRHQHRHDLYKRNPISFSLISGREKPLLNLTTTLLESAQAPDPSYQIIRPKGQRQTAVLQSPTWLSRTSSTEIGPHFPRIHPTLHRLLPAIRLVHLGIRICIPKLLSVWCIRMMSSRAPIRPIIMLPTVHLHLDR